MYNYLAHFFKAVIYHNVNKDTFRPYLFKQFRNVLSVHMFTLEAGATINNVQFSKKRNIFQVCWWVCLDRKVIYRPFYTISTAICMLLWFIRILSKPVCYAYCFMSLLGGDHWSLYVVDTSRKFPLYIRVRIFFPQFHKTPFSRRFLQKKYVLDSSKDTLASYVNCFSITAACIDFHHLSDAMSCFPNFLK